MTDVIFIPARAGSQGVKGKNKKLLCGKPLISHTVDFAKSLKGDFDIIVSTDDFDIFNMFKNDPQIKCDELRPSKLSGPRVQTKEVIDYELNKLFKSYENLWLFQPTCPFRQIETFEKCKYFLGKDFASVVTVKDVEGEHPLRMKRLIGNILVNYVDTGAENMKPRQSLPRVYLRSGGIYGIKKEVFERQLELVVDPCAGVIVEGSEIVNIDTKIDFQLAEILGNEKK